MVDRMLAVDVVYADPERQILRRIEVTTGSTVGQAVEASGIPEMLPDGSVDPGRLGVHGRKVASTQPVQAGDRIEIYRPLTLDPMEARRRRAR